MNRDVLWALLFVLIALWFAVRMNRRDPILPRPHTSTKRNSTQAVP